jgi:hypothetical protein
MSINRRDLVRLRLPLLGFFCSLSLAGALLAWSESLRWHAEQARDTARSSKNRIEQRLNQANGEAQNLAERAAVFRQMQETGILGEEKRLEWTEMLLALQRRLRLPGLHYEFAAQTPLDTGNCSARHCYSSLLLLQLRLLHEADLLDLLAHIEREAKALVVLQGCRLQPLKQSTETARLNAECRMQWITLRLGPENK